MRAVAASLAMLVGLTLTGCQEMSSYRNPLFASDPPPRTTLLTSAVTCFGSVDVASGGEQVRRATNFGPIAAQRLNLRLARIGHTAPPLPNTLCHELTGAEAAHHEIWSAPKMPPILKDLVQMSGAESGLLPVVETQFTCAKAGRWIWGEPSYEDERGLVDCHESKLVFAAYLFAPDGALLWKAHHTYHLERTPDPDEMSRSLLERAPIGEAASF